MKFLLLFIWPFFVLSIQSFNVVDFGAIGIHLHLHFLLFVVTLRRWPDAEHARLSLGLPRCCALCGLAIGAPCCMLSRSAIGEIRHG
jgi:hypothetical protein